MYKEELEVSEEEMKGIDECDMEEFGILDSREKTVAIPGDRWWPQVAQQERGQTSTNNLPGMYYLETT